MRQQCSLGIFNREIFLVIAHHRHQYLFRKREKLRIETAQNHGRKLGEIDDRRHQRLVLSPARSGDRASRGVERLADDMLAFGSTQHLGAAQRFHVGTGAPDGDILTADDSVTAGSLPRRNAE